jgi:nucleoside-diphosphate-sugar epimerase
MSSSTPAASNGRVAVVTGATGFIAGHIVDQLLRLGYSVRGTVRSLSDPKSVALQKQFPSVRLFEADLTVAGSFASAVKGAHYVFHAASVVKLAAADGQAEIITPAVNMTVNVVSAALAEPTVRRIILTSSAITALDINKPAGYVYTEADWNDSWPAAQAPYQFSKVQAERKAWQLVEEHNARNAAHPVSLVTILPSSVLGPPIGSRVDGYSVSILTDLLNGSQLESGVNPLNFTDVDVREAAAAHVQAAERQQASGRYLVSNTKPADPLQYVQLLRPRFPKRQLPSKQAAPWILQDYTVDNSRSIRELGITYRPLQDSVNDTVDKLISIGLIKPPQDD